MTITQVEAAVALKKGPASNDSAKAEAAAAKAGVAESED